MGHRAKAVYCPHLTSPALQGCLLETTFSHEASRISMRRHSHRAITQE